jgi:hypothetical protein
MPLRARADVIRVADFKPPATGRHLVDTNIWLGMLAPEATLNPRGDVAAQFKPYLDLLALIKKAGGQLYCCAIQFAEIAHRLEKLALDRYRQSTGLANTKMKEFRYDCPGPRAVYLKELAGAWEVLTGMAETVPSTIDATSVQQCLDGFVSRKEGVDPYDSFQIDSMRAAEITDVITDDADFVTVQGIRLITANANAIEAARKAGRLAK